MVKVLRELPLPSTAHQREQGVVACEKITLHEMVIGRLARRADGHAAFAWNRAAHLTALEAIIGEEYLEITAIETVEW